MLEQNEQIDKNNTAELEYAGFWLRFRAHIIDGFLIFPIAALFNLVLYDLLSGFVLADKVIESYLELGVSMAGGMFKEDPLLAFLIVISFFPVFITFLFVLVVLAFLIETAITYAPIVIIFWIKKQATPGKMVISIKVVDAKTGAKPTSAQCVGRYLAYFASALPFGMGFLWVAFDKRKQGWHDKLAGTVVIGKKNLPSTAETKEDMGARETQSKDHAPKTRKEDWEYAGFWVRCGAWIMDLVILSLIQFALAIWIPILFGEVWVSKLIGIIIGFIVIPIYVIGFWFKNQATPGKTIISASIVVDAETGESPSLNQCLRRYLVLWFPFGLLDSVGRIAIGVELSLSFSFFFLFLLLLLALVVLWVAVDKRKQGWHDKFAGTVVVRKRIPSEATGREKS